MSYLNEAQDPRRRATAIAVTAAVHAAIGLGVVTGLTIAGYKPLKDYRPILEFPTQPEPPEPKPSPSANVDPVAPMPPAPMPPIPIPPQPGPTYEPFDPTAATIPDVLPLPNPGPTFTPQPPRPSPSFTPTSARPIGRPSAWISTDDYPRRPLVDEIEGIAGYRLIVGSNGRVSSCEVVSSSGNAQLDAATCRLLTSRARFEAATDEAGAKVVGSYTGSVRWEIPD